MYLIEKNTLVEHQSFCYSELFLIWPWSPDKPTTHMTSLGKFGSGQGHLAPINQKYDLQSFPSLLTISI